MSDIDDLWGRIDDAKTRLGLVDQAQIKQIEGLNDRVKTIKRGLSRRYRELEGHREEVSGLRHENEQLRRMLHRLLLAIEERYGGRLKDILQDLETQVGALVALTDDTAANKAPAIASEGDPPADPESDLDAALTDTADDAIVAEVEADADEAEADAAEPDAAASVKVGALQARLARPSETDSRWLHEIMERARELTGERSKAAKVAPIAPAARRAIA